MKKRLLSLLLAALMLLSACGTGGEQTPDASPVIEDELPTMQTVDEKAQTDGKFTLNYDPNASMNPVQASSAANLQLCSLLYDSVFTVDSEWNVSSEIVESWKSDDYIWWVFEIKPDICFSDGQVLTAGDVVYSIQRAQQSSYYRQRLSIIYGISALDDITFAITTQYADSLFPALLNIPIIKKGSYGEDRPLGTGPYMLDAESDTLVLNPLSRHAGEMPIDTIYLADYTDTSARITGFEEAGLDLVTNDPTGMYNLGYGSGTEIRYYDTSNLHYIGFNARSNFFQVPRVRYALGYAIDRENIVKEFMNGCGTPTVLPVHPGSSLYDNEYAQTFRYDLETAKALFQSGGIDDLDNDGALEVLVTGIVVELDIKFIVNNDSTSKVLAARALTETLNEIGITTTLYELDFDSYVEALETGDYDMYYGEVRMAADWDLSYLFKVRSAAQAGDDFSGMNYAHTTDATYCDLYAAYLAAPEEDRAAAFGEVLQYIGQSGIILPICFERREVITHRGVVGGINATQYDLFNKFGEWTIDID